MLWVGIAIVETGCFRQGLLYCGGCILWVSIAAVEYVLPCRFSFHCEGCGLWPTTVTTPTDSFWCVLPWRLHVDGRYCYYGSGWVLL